jgi:hypothetical protein
MTYRELEEKIMEMAASATDAARLRFARETVGLLRNVADHAIATELTEAEQKMLALILADVASGSMDGLNSKLKQLNDSMCRDEIRAIEFDSDITELLCAIDNLLAYFAASDPEYVGKIGINMVNSIDNAIGGDSESYSIHEMMGAEEMRREYERQRTLLVGPGNGVSGAGS